MATREGRGEINVTFLPRAAIRNFLRIRDSLRSVHLSRGIEELKEAARGFVLPTGVVFVRNQKFITLFIFIQEIFKYSILSLFVLE